MTEMTSSKLFPSSRRLAWAMGLAFAVGVLAPQASFSADSKASRYYEDALVRYEKKDIDGAIIQLKNALQIDNSLLPVQMLLGKALMQNGEVAAAEVALTEALRLGVNRAEVVILLGQAYLAQGKHKLLFEQHQFGLTGLPPTVQLQLLLLRSAAHADLGNLREALKAVEDARAIDARATEVWLAEVPIRIRARQFREAKTAAERALALAPDSAEAWYQKASVSHVSGELSAALAAYDRALKLDAAHLEARIARAGLYIDLGRQSDAASDVRELKRTSPQEPRAAYLRALLAERDNKPEEARQALRDLTGLIDPVPMDFIRYRPQMLMLNGLAHFGLDEREKAKGYLEAFQRVQGNTAAAKLLAQIYLGESRADRAIEVLEAYLKVQPADGQAMVLLGSAYMSKGQHARAVSFMKQALETRDAPEFRTVLGLSLIRSGQAVSAIPELEAALKLNPGQTQAATALIALYLKAGQTAKAVALAEGLVKQQPANAEFLNLLGVTKRHAGSQAAARKAFEQAIKLNNKLVSPKLNLARIEIAEKAFDAAALRLDTILRADDKNTEAMFEMGALSEQRGQLPEAQRWLEKAADSAGPKEVRWALALSDFHMRHGKPGPALDAAKVASSKAPEDLSVLIILARVQLANNDNAGAKNTLSTATRVAEFNPAVQVQIALLQLAANHPAGAAYSLEKALSGQPDFFPAQVLMAEVELRQGEAAKAEKRARDIVAKYPKRAIGYSLLGDIAQARGQITEAQEAYRRAHQTEPSTDTLLRLFRALASKDDKSSLQLAEQWMKSHPQDTSVLKALAEGYFRTGKLAAARTAYENLLKITPDDGVALNNLANVMHRLKDPAAARIAEQAVAKNPGNSYAIDTLGWILLQTGETGRALQLLRDARLRAPGNPEIRYHLAVALDKSGRKAEAREELAEALKARVAFEGIEDARKLEKELGR
ncbi:MAG: PEP-CTERM system TPR-repeat protein PrsT [Rhodocyclaceae bacterium]|nr:PEP-CTERM system TPR-repeat protein PrsT [Rhodocyclaceae bacterium]